jgi:hypothetical protein
MPALWHWFKDRRLEPQAFKPPAVSHRAHWLARLFLHRGLRVRTRPQGASERQGDAAALHEAYARHAGRHGPNRLLPAKVLPAQGRAPGTADPPLTASSDGSTAEHSAQKE